MAVLPSAPKAASVASTLLELGHEIMIRRKIPKGMVGYRIPTLADYVKQNEINEVNESLVLELAEKDDLINYFFAPHGFRVIAARRDYFPEDKDSMGWGIIMQATE